MGHDSCLKACIAPGKECAATLEAPGKEPDWCCCPHGGGEGECRTDTFVDNGTGCQRRCCDNGWVPCGYGCCDSSQQCGFNITSPTNHHGGNLKLVECCTNTRYDLSAQEKEGCCAWGRGIDCRIPQQRRPCCLECLQQFRTISSGLTICEAEEWDETYHCQVDCSKWRPLPSHRLRDSLEVGSGVLVLLVGLCVVRFCKRRRRRSQQALLLGGQGTGQEASEGTSHGTTLEEQDEQGSEHPWFALIVGVPEVHVPRRRLRAWRRPVTYPKLDRVRQDVERLAEKLRRLHPRMQIIQCLGPDKRELEDAMQTLVSKLSGTTLAHVIIYSSGHGHNNILIAKDGGHVEIDRSLEAITKGNRSYTWSQATRPRVLVFWDHCRTPLPDGSLENPPFVPARRMPSDGSLLVIYATNQNRPATEGAFIDGLLMALDEPGLTAFQIYDRIQSSMVHQQAQVLFEGDESLREMVINSTRPASSSTASEVTDA